MPSDDIHTNVDCVVNSECPECGETCGSDGHCLRCGYSAGDDVTKVKMLDTEHLRNPYEDDYESIMQKIQPCASAFSTSCPRRSQKLVQKLSQTEMRSSQKMIGRFCR